MRYLENAVDGFALLQLVRDLEEFQQLVPRAGVRLKVKALRREGPLHKAS